jgi:hypothetical protein
MIMERKIRSLVDVHNAMCERMDITLCNDLTEEQRAIENEQSRLFLGIAKQTINNGKLILEYEKALAQRKTLTNSVLKDIIYGEQK